MANNTILVDTALPSPVIDGFFRDKNTGNWWNNSTHALEAWTLANYANYAVAFVEQGGANTSGMQVLTIPALLPASRYDIIVRARVGGSPVVTDKRAAAGDLSWNGSGITDPNLIGPVGIAGVE